MSEEETTKPVQAPVCRNARRTFVQRVTAFCLVSSVAMVFFTPVAALPLAEVAVRALISLATFVVLTYIGASSVDYNGGITKMFKK
jgi:hypothetical protein